MILINFLTNELKGKGMIWKIFTLHIIVSKQVSDLRPKRLPGNALFADWNHNDEGQMRQLISVDEMTKLVNSTMDVRDKAVITLLAKTGIKRKELITLDVDDIDWVDQSIRLKPTPKRTNRIVFFDD